MQLLLLRLRKTRTDRIAQSIPALTCSSSPPILHCNCHCRVSFSVAAGPFNLFTLRSLFTPNSPLLLPLNLSPTHPAFFSPRATYPAIQICQGLLPGHIPTTIFGSGDRKRLGRSPVTNCQVAPTSPSCAILRVETVSVIATISTTISAPPSSRVQYKSRTDPRSLQIRF